MSDSLKDQLIALGLAEDKPKPKRRKPSGKSRHARGKAGGKAAAAKPGGKGGEISLDQAWKLKARDEKQAVAESKARKLEIERERRRINGEIKALVEANRLNDPKAELKRNFLYKDRIRSVLVTSEQLAALNAGELGLVFLRGNYHLVKAEVAEQAKAISPDHVPELAAAADDADGDHPVPDDLVW
ncbi:DUF2058 domain-containing protein [Marinihelvus fidelis]|uniref:DUF2058 domain-containing protein n=1 Tax=Marinihelvus fidelis TaxID=2613842 RepID=A0A5N0TE80_9GAMM|nr:DUF2058 family protein [Marinihelvus fidelis]KAA9133290.1 DUF2058 domain-containing protein [Marinihelvus fidelis]